MTLAEQRQIDDTVRRAIEENTLHWWVETFGLWQYLLAPLLLYLSLVGLVRAQRMPARLPFAVTAIIAVVAMAMMWHRAYFTSLGW